MMRKSYFPHSFKLCFMLLLILCKSSFGYAQLAMAVKRSTHKLTTIQQFDNTKISLKEALNSLKKQYNIQIAYKEGLLENKEVPVSILSGSDKSLDQQFKKVLEGFSLDFQKINENQYSVFEKISAPTADVINGKVVSAKDGSAIVGASVFLKDYTSNGTTTDANGRFRLNIPESLKGKALVLQVVYIGYIKKELTVSNSDADVLVSLEESNTNLSEVVVTALGIKKDRKALAYSVTEVKGSELTQARENNVANALSGKVAGVNVAGLSTGPGGSSRVTIRGNGSLGGSNQPLYVINGMPMDNSVPGGAPTINGITSNIDRGDGIAAINPDDIESITVLKGGPAAALYGSRASNGVILITTKKGRAQKGVGLDFSSIATFDNVAVSPDYQYEYGQGDRGVKPTTLADAQATGRRSFGSKIDGSTNYVAVDGLTHPYVAQPDNVKNFYQTGKTFTNSLAFSGGNEAITYRFSAADLDSKGILDKTTYNRKTFNLALNAKPSDKITIEALAQYNLEKGNNRTGAGDAFGNPNWTPLEVANTVDVRWLNPGFDANGNESIWNDASVASNGYFVINKFKQQDTKNRFIGQGSVAYEPIKNLIFKGTISRDFYSYNSTNIVPTGALFSFQGEYSALKSEVSETNALVTANYRGTVANHFNFSVLAGGNQRRFVQDDLATTGRGFNIPYLYNITNLTTSFNTPTYNRIYTNSLFGSVDLDYKSLLFLTFTGRTDWFSNLSPQNNNLFYPSIGASFILSDAVKLPSLFNLAKIRASYAQVGGSGPDAYTINLAYQGVTSSGQPLQNVSSPNLTNPTLRPFVSTTYEAGLEFQMLKNRLGFDLTYYDRKTTDDIVRTTVSNTSGYSTALLNVGELSNKGVEALVNGSPIKSKNFTWSASYNIAYNKSEVVKLAPGLSSISLASTVGGWGNFNQIEGLPFGQIVGTRILKDANGNTVYNPSSGVPVATPLQPLGNSVAPLTMGLSNDFKYKNFSLNVLLDGKFGNKVFSVMEVYATRLGLMKSTLPGRENGLVLNGVTPTGAAYTRTVPVTDLRTYYNEFRNYSELFVHDGSFIKLRQVILTYNIPNNYLKFAKIQSASLSFVARNLAILYKQTDNFDPEQSFTNSDYQGFESIGLPRTRSYGLSLNVKF